MGLFQHLFGKKKTSEQKAAQSPAPVGSHSDVSYHNDFVEIKSINFFGQYEKSKSGEWVVCWSDSDKENQRGGYRDSGHGTYALYNTIQNRTIQQGKLERPNSGMVANNGNFSIEDWHFGSYLSGTFYVFSSSGEVVIKKPLKANILNSAISIEGQFAVCQTANNPSGDDGNLFCAFDLINKIELFSIHPQTGWADSYGFIEQKPHFLISLKGIGKFRYDKNGNFIDLEKYDKARLGSKQYDVALLAAEEALKSTDIDSTRLETILGTVLRARESGADKNQSWKCLALKLQGIVLEEMGRLKEALDIYDEVLRINPKIGVKRKAGALRKKLDSNVE